MDLHGGDEWKRRVRRWALAILAGQLGAALASESGLSWLARRAVRLGLSLLGLSS